MVIIAVCAAILSGCGGPGNQTSVSNKPLTDFLALHEKFCESNYNSPESLVDALAKADGFDPIEQNIGGIFETIVNKVSYAVSSEETGCTTDLQLKKEGSKKVYFEFEELHAELLARGYRPSGNKRLGKQMGMDKKTLDVVEMKYLSPRNTTTIVAFPLEREDQYYMTLFAEKFNNDERKYVPMNVTTKMREI